MSNQSAGPINKVLNPFVDFTPQQLADLKALLLRADVNPLTPNSQGGWGWNGRLTPYECDLLYQAWHSLLFVFESALNAGAILPAAKGIAA